MGWRGARGRRRTSFRRRRRWRRPCVGAVAGGAACSRHGGDVSGGGGDGARYGAGESAGAPRDGDCPPVPASAGSAGTRRRAPAAAAATRSCAGPSRSDWRPPRGQSGPGGYGRRDGGRGGGGCGGRRRPGRGDHVVRQAPERAPPSQRRNLRVSAAPPSQLYCSFRPPRGPPLPLPLGPGLRGPGSALARRRRRRSYGRAARLGAAVFSVTGARDLTRSLIGSPSRR